MAKDHSHENNPNYDDSYREKQRNFDLVSCQHLFEIRRKGCVAIEFVMLIPYRPIADQFVASFR